MSPPHAPAFHNLTRRSCMAILARNHVGRVAFGRHDWVDIRPLHYVLADAWIYARTSPSSKVETIAHNPWVAFEVDEIADLFDWRSVVVHGAWYPLEGAPPSEAKSWAIGVAKLRALIPGALTPRDPVPQRSVVFRIHVDAVTGRSCTPTPRPSTRPRRVIS